MTVAVGIDDPTLLGEQTAAQDEWIATLEAENGLLREELDAKDRRIEDVEQRLDAVEARDGTTIEPADV